MNFLQKYKKYKNKYLELKNLFQKGGNRILRSRYLYSKIVLQDYLPSASAEYNRINEVNLDYYNFYVKDTYNPVTYFGPKINIIDLQPDIEYHVTLTDSSDPSAIGRHNLIKTVKFIKFVV